MKTLQVGAVMATPSWLIDLDQVHSSYLLLATLAALQTYTHGSTKQSKLTRSRNGFT
jgi:hypothetical protein